MNMVYVTKFLKLIKMNVQSLHFFKWLIIQIWVWQSFPHLQMKSLLMLSWQTFLFFHRLLFSFSKSILVFSACLVPARVCCLYASRSVASNSKSSMSILEALRSRLHASLKRRSGRPVQDPFWSSPYKSCFGILIISILFTCPSHLRRRLLSIWWNLPFSRLQY